MWDEIMASIHAEALDCLQANLAVLADRWHGAGTHLRLGAALGFAPQPAWPLPTVDPGLAGRLTEAEELLGLVVRERYSRIQGPELRMLAAASGPVYVVADAHDLPWVPYYRQRQVEHSFLLTAGTGGWTVVDAYHNDTPWGQARPCVLRLDASTIDAAVAGACALVLAPVQLPATVPVRVRPPDPGEVAAYITAYRGHPERAVAMDRLTVETWLLARARRLHAAWTRSPADAEHADTWSALAEQVYLALRRVERGRPEPPGTLDRLSGVLLAEAQHPEAQHPEAQHPEAQHPEAQHPEAQHPEAQHPVTEPATAAEPVRAAVLTAASRVLGVDREALAAGRSFVDIPTFSSFRLVDILEQVELALGLELPAAELLPERLHDADTMSRLFFRHAQGASSHA
jgi:hypothetical protein